MHFTIMTRLLKSTVLLFAFSLACSSLANANGLHAKWQVLLSEHVKTINMGHSTELDYSGIASQSNVLKDYLNDLSAITQTEFDNWDKNTQLAFLINAYNAWTVKLILTDYPNLKSIRDLGGLFSSPWKKEFIPLLGKSRSLDNIEHDLIRGANKYNEPRIHFAVNCASIACPALREEAFIADKLDNQLQEQTIRFLSDTSRNYANSDAFYLSSIFKWYNDDFNLGFRDTTSLNTFLLLYADHMNLSNAQKASLKGNTASFRYLDYNWKLNDTK